MVSNKAPFRVARMFRVMALLFAVNALGAPDSRFPLRDMDSDRRNTSIDPYGFERPEDFDYATYNEFIASYLRTLARRKLRWEKLHPTRKLKHSAKVKRYVRKGIPEEHRKLVWLVSSGAQKRWNENPDLYKKLLKAKKDEEMIEIIKTDIPRTFPDNIYFQNPGQGFLHPLYNVLVAFVNYHPEIGYCQGLNYIAGLLLLIVKEETAAFWLLTTLIDKILPDYYSSGMKGLLVDTEVIAELVRNRQPLVHHHLEKLGITWPLLCTKWFICLFVDVLPIETVLRIWDCMFYEGSKILLRVGITLIMMNSTNLLLCSDIGEAIDCIHTLAKSEPIVKCHDFMQDIFKIPGSLPSRDIDRLRQKYTEFSKVPS